MAWRVSRFAGEVRAAKFAAKCGTCAVHQREARSLHRTLEELARRDLPDVDPENTIVELLRGASRTLSAFPDDPITSQERFALRRQMMINSEMMAIALKRSVMDHLRQRLLGRAAAKSTWQAQTLPVRSLRGVVAERVRWRGGCSCPDRGEAVQPRVEADEA
jgi:hypothetical protein